MADLIKEANWLRFYYTSDDAVKDKDLLKDQAHIKTSQKVSTLMTVPFFFQIWQLSLVNHPDSIQLYRKVRSLKAATFLGAVAFGSYELLNMRKQWTYYDRFYPEPTELQKTLNREAMMFKEQNYQTSSVEDKLKKLEDPNLRLIYSQMYQLPPQKYADPDNNVNAPDHTEHDQS